MGCIEGSSLASGMDTSPLAVLTKVTVFGFSDAEDVVGGESGMETSFAENCMMLALLFNEVECFVEQIH
jgi:hypothetical protein